MQRPYDTRTNSGVAFASGINFILGIWLIAAPFVLDYTDYGNSMWNAIIVGIVVASLAGLRFIATSSTSVLSMLNIALGAWLIAGPFVFNNADVSSIVWNHVLVGIAIIAFGAWSLSASGAAGSLGGRQPR